MVQFCQNREAQQQNTSSSFTRKIKCFQNKYEYKNQTHSHQANLWLMFSRLLPALWDIQETDSCSNLLVACTSWTSEINQNVLKSDLHYMVLLLHVICGKSTPVQKTLQVVNRHLCLLRWASDDFRVSSFTFVPPMNCPRWTPVILHSGVF